MSQSEGQPLVRTFRVYATKGDLTKKQVEVAIDGPFLNPATREPKNDLAPNIDSEVKSCKHAVDGRLDYRA